ncbi:HYR-like domain-containing protein, partial [Winogradskyella immobilis]|nr:hypothetical protein [Winogradskyella immobilis]MCG0017765.1 hypothetical protein [Winogradskyella immobilis]
TVTDEAGNSATCEQTVTITDDEDPSITCPADLTAICDISEQPAYTSFSEFMIANGSASDNCDIDESSFRLVSETSDNGICPEIVTRVYQISDLAGNTSTCSHTITINDEIDPIIDTTDIENIEIQCGVTPDGTLEAWLADNAGATATDNCTAQNDIIWTNDFGQITDVDCAGGPITVTFTATDVCGNFSEVTATYSIIDTVAPVLTIPSDQTLECDQDNSTDATGVATATDNCTTPTITFEDVINDGDCAGNFTITRTWTATDACGNATSEDQTITIQDTTAPTFTVPADITIECDQDANDLT